MASDGRFIQGAIKRPGQLHRDLGVPQGQKIPRSAIEAAAKRKGKVGQRARLALTLEGMHGGGTASSAGAGADGLARAAAGR